MRALVDTNIVLDVLLDREPFVTDSLKVWTAADAGDFVACISAFSIPTIHYICQRAAGRARADQAVDVCLKAFEVCSLYRECIIAARRMGGGDFEDNLQVACAITDFVPVIVTRNLADFANRPIRALSPADFLKELGQGV
jgi:predicted nucleic acid-binding protein